MSRPLFEVVDLRVAVFDADRAVEGVPGPTTDSGEDLPPGWVEVIPRLSFSVEPGEVLAIVGESASGKSLALMGGFALLSPGSRVIGGEARYKDTTFRPGGSLDVSSSRGARKRRREARLAGTVIADDGDESWAHVMGAEIGFIFQNPIGSWNPDHVIGAQSGEALSVHSDLTADEIEARVLDALGEVNLPRSRRMLGAFRHELSRGMAQRAMLAAALTKTPSLLIADEPLNGLDAPVAAAIMDLIKDMQAKRDMAMIIVTHDLAAVAGIADRVVVLYGGEIVEDAPVVDLYHRPKHPYTSGLIGSIPGASPGRLRHMKGEAPRLVDVVRSACSFAERCPIATLICRSAHPE
ncbi:MAG: ABC transporter ATP-binding protein, partial [Actinomycetia bacterium]|nr:ABC transporter ATP-binding protein [Actinomycetes bacterium]